MSESERGKSWWDTTNTQLCHLYLYVATPENSGGTESASESKSDSATCSRNPKREVTDGCRLDLKGNLRKQSLDLTLHSVAERLFDRTQANRLEKGEFYSFCKNKETSLDKLDVHLRQQGFYFGLRFVGVAFAIEDEREGLEMSEGLQLRASRVGKVNA